MGREASAELKFMGATGPGKIVLESEDLILRGAVKARIARRDLSGFAAEGDDLVIHTPQGPLRARLGPKESVAWVKALAKPAPGLAAKLGLSAASPVRLLAPLRDLALIAATEGHLSPTATLLLAEIEDAATLDRALALLVAEPLTAIWAVTIKGKASPLPEATLRERLRAAGFIDTKSCKVSESRAATRFQRR